MSDTAPTGVLTAGAGPGVEKVPTGIRGFDEITGGGLPAGRVTLVTGGAGTGKTLLGVQFLAAGARDRGEPAVLVTFEESASQLAANVRSLGIDLDAMRRDGLLVVLAYQVDPAEIVTTGEFDFEPLFAALGEAIDRVGARRILLDMIETLFSSFGDNASVRGGLRRLARWLEDRGVTAIMTGERGEKTITRHGIEEYVSDCVIVLDHRVREEVSTRRLRVLKYRGSAHSSNEFPFLISASGLTVLPATSITLDYAASAARVSTGVPRLDHMLGGGVFQGSSVLVTGAAGTGKTSLGACLVDATCRRGEHALMFSFDESAESLLRNMRSIGLDLRQWVDRGLLRICAARPATSGLESNLALLLQLVEDEEAPSVAVLDGITSLLGTGTGAEVTSMLDRLFDLLKTRRVTTMATVLGRTGGPADVNVSSLADTWIRLSTVEANGERNRLLFVLKSRGTAHSNQAREFQFTEHGIELVDVYVGAGGVLTGSARLAQQAAERAADVQRADDVDRRRHALLRAIREREAQLAVVQDQIAADRAEVERLEGAERREAADVKADRLAMAAHRWADTAPPVPSVAAVPTQEGSYEHGQRDRTR